MGALRQCYYSAKQQVSVHIEEVTPTQKPASDPEFTDGSDGKFSCCVKEGKFVHSSGMCLSIIN